MVDRFVSWPTDVLRPTTSLQARLALRIAEETGKQPVLPPAPASGPSRNGNRSRPGSNASCSRPTRNGTGSACWCASRPARSYPAHTHAGVEELHLLDGELWIDERKLFPGDYNYGAPGTGDERVWSETGCTCVLITSTKDVLQ